MRLPEPWGKSVALSVVPWAQRAGSVCPDCDGTLAVCPSRGHSCAPLRGGGKHLIGPGSGGPAPLPCRGETLGPGECVQSRNAQVLYVGFALPWGATIP